MCFMILEYHQRDIMPEHKMDISMDNTRDEVLLSVAQSLSDLQQISSEAISPGSSTLFSRPLQRKLETLVKCNLHDVQGPSVAMRSAWSVAERAVNDLTVRLQTQQHEKINIWTAIRSHGCQFLGPAMQEEVLKLILLALEDGSSLSRKVLVLFVVQRLHLQFPQASKTSVGHVVQLLYRASCFNVIKRDEESSLMQLKDEFRNYEELRCQHDMQIVEISREFGLRIGPEQWSCLLYGDNKHRSHMQSIIDKLSKRQTLLRNADDLMAILKKSGDRLDLSADLQLLLDLFVDSQQNSSALKSPTVSLPHLDSCLKAILKVVSALARSLRLKQAQKADHHNPTLQNCYLETGCRSSGEIRVTAALDSSISPSGNSGSYSKSYQEPLNESSAGSQQKFTQAVQPAAQFLNGSSTADEVSDVAAALRCCDLGCTEAQCSSSSMISEDGHYPLPSAAYPSGAAVSSHMNYSSCESLPFHLASQSPFFPPPLNVVTSERVCTPLTGGYGPSPVLLSIHNVQQGPSNFFQPVWYPAPDVVLNSSSTSDLHPS